jgi:hypothetical protein
MGTERLGLGVSARAGCRTRRTSEGRCGGSFLSLTVEKEVTRVASDGQWLCLTPWSNAVNTHCWGFGKVPAGAAVVPGAC